MKDITVQAKDFAFRCECGQIHTVSFPDVDLPTTRYPSMALKIPIYECKHQVVISWTGEHFEIRDRGIPEPHPKNLQEELIIFITRFGFGGDLYDPRYLYKWWAWPIRAAQKWAHKQWRKNCKKFGWRQFAEGTNYFPKAKPVFYITEE